MEDEYNGMLVQTSDEPTKPSDDDKIAKWVQDYNKKEVADMAVKPGSSAVMHSQTKTEGEYHPLWEPSVPSSYDAVNDPYRDFRMKSLHERSTANEHFDPIGYNAFTGEDNQSQTAAVAPPSAFKPTRAAASRAPTSSTAGGGSSAS